MGKTLRGTLAACLAIGVITLAIHTGATRGPEVIGNMAVEKLASDVTEVVSVVRMATDSRGNPVPPYLADVSPVRR